jgi:hypothetical protein
VQLSLLTFAITGSIASLLLILAGFVWLGLRREFEHSRMTPEEAGDFVVRGWRQRPAFVWFRGLASGISISAEKPTREIISLLAQGRWAEGLPWATPALGALGAFFFWSLLVGLLVGLRGFGLWAMTAFFFGSALMAAWPREDTRTTDSEEDDR